MTTASYIFNEDMRAGGTFYEDIYNKVAEMITDGIENRQSANKTPFKRTIRNLDKTELQKHEYNKQETKSLTPEYTKITIEKALEIAKEIIKKIGDNASKNRAMDIAKDIMENFAERFMENDNLDSKVIDIAQKIGKNLPSNKIIDIIKGTLGNLMTQN